MRVDALQQTLGVQAVQPKQDANRQSGRDPQHKGKRGHCGQEPQDEPQIFLNALGQATGKTINITA